MVSAQSCYNFDDTSASPRDKKEIWTIARGHDFGAFEYFDSQGYIVGFSGELVEEVCRAAGIDCRLIWDKYTNCWQSSPGEHPSGGPGLLGEWYDACVGYAVTLERFHVFDFTAPFLKPLESYLFTLPGNVNSFNANDLRNRNIGFFEGWFSDEKCLARQDGVDGRQGYILPTDNIVYMTGPNEVMEKFNDGSIDAVFAGLHDLSSFVNDGTLAKVNVPFSCTVTGTATMTRKGSAFIDHWNRGFQILRSTGKLFKMCQAARQDHGDQGDINCVD